MALISRSDAGALMPEDAAQVVIDGMPESSAVMRLGRQLPNMSRNQRRMPVVDSLLTAYFVTGDTGQKQTSKMAWANKYINAEELAVIVPIPENVLDDSEYDIWSQVQPRISEAFGIAFDAAVLRGTNAPAAWPTALLTGSLAAGNQVVLGAGGGDLYDDIMGESGVIAKVEEDGFMVNGHVAALNLRAKLRGLRNDDGQPLFVTSLQSGGGYELDGNSIFFPRNGSMDATSALLFSGDWDQLVWSTRTDITYKLLDQAVIQDTNGDILYNLAQQDMVALRAVMRIGWQLPNPINRIQSVEANRYPFATLVPAEA